jgi:cytoskeletal protein RodZ
MTTARSAPRTAHAPTRFASSPAGSEPGDRLKRLRRRRRLLREELLVVLFLLLALAVTVAVLAKQWLASGPASTAPGPARAGQIASAAAWSSSPLSFDRQQSYISLSNLGGSA